MQCSRLILEDQQLWQRIYGTRLCEWGGDTQQDIIEATEWAIDQGIADAEKIGIYGGSFGGYSAAMAPMLRPDLYKSSVAYIGVFDLEMLYNEGDIKGIKWGGKYLDKTLGQDPEKIKEMSPVHQHINYKHQ